MGEETPKPMSTRAASVLGMLFALSDTHTARVPDVSPIGYECSVCHQQHGHAPECQKPRGLIPITRKP